MSEPWIDPTMSRHHPLFGQMDKKSPWQINQALLHYRPSRVQLDELAAEELAGKDRPEVYRIFARFRV